MRIKIILIISLILVLSACTKNTQEIKPNETQQEIVNNEKTDSIQDTSSLNVSDVIDSDLDKLSFKIDKVHYNGQQITVIEPSIPKDSGISFFDFFENNKIIVGIGYLKNDSESNLALFMFDLDSGEKHEIYRGEGYADNVFSQFRILKSGDLVFQTEQFIIFIDRENYKIKSFQKVPEDCTDFALSNDGSRIAYRNENGLYVSDLSFTSPKLLVESEKGQDPNGLDSKGPGFPRWASDDRKISYIKYIYEGSEGFGMVNLDGFDNVTFTKPDFYPLFAYFYSNSEKILCGQDCYDTPYLYTINLTDSKLQPIDIEENWRDATPYPYGKKYAYTVYHTYIDSQLFIYDFEKQTKRALTPVMDAINSMKWHNSGEKIIAQTNQKVIIVPTND